MIMMVEMKMVKTRMKITTVFISVFVIIMLLGLWLEGSLRRDFHYYFDGFNHPDQNKNDYEYSIIHYMMII